MRRIKMKSFAEFIIEDFNSHGALQFLIPVSTNTRGSKGSSSAKSVMMFYENVKTTSFNLTKYLNSFMRTDVSDIMQAPGNNYRILIYGSVNGFHVFVWTASIQHTQMVRSLDANKNLNKFPANIKYQFFYNECQMYMEGDVIGNEWCFPLILWEGELKINITPESKNVLDRAKDIQTVFQLSNSQWKSL